METPIFSALFHCLDKAGRHIGGALKKPSGQDTKCGLQPTADKTALEQPWNSPKELREEHQAPNTTQGAPKTELRDQPFPGGSSHKTASTTSWQWSMGSPKAKSSAEPYPGPTPHKLLKQLSTAAGSGCHSTANKGPLTGPCKAQPQQCWLPRTLLQLTTPGSPPPPASHCTGQCRP